MREDEAVRVECEPDYEPDVVEDDGAGEWRCPACGVMNSRVDGECQFCDEEE